MVIGHNRSIAWGFTNLYPDTEDLYLEKIDGNRYLYNGSWLPLQTRRETFDIRGESPETITVRTTRAGPIVSDVDDDLESVGRDAPASERRARPRSRLCGRAALDGARARQHRRRALRHRPGAELDRSSATRPATSTRRARTSCTPMSTATSATRRRD